MENKTQLWLRKNIWRVLDSVVDSIVIIDANGIIQHVNNATLVTFGYTEKELIAAPLTILMPEPYRSEHQSYISNYLSSGDAKIIGLGRNLTAQTKGGRVFPIYLAINEIVDDDGSHFSGIIHDITDQEASHSKILEQQSQLAHAGRVSNMGELTASIAHEINQPLTAIALYTQACIRMLEKDNFDKARLSQALKKLAAQSLRAGAVIERVQRFMRKETARKDLEDLGSLVMDLKPLVEGDARLQGIELEFSIHGVLEKVRCDPIQIQQITLNLIRNAVDAMTEIECRHGNVVQISVSQVNAESLEVRVNDTGTGVAEDQMSSIFTAFHTTKTDGMGMGLSICKSIIDHHGGTLEFRNNAQAGTSFFFLLPVAKNTDEGESVDTEVVNDEWGEFNE